MESKNINLSSWSRHLGQDLKRDKKKAVILGVLAVVAVVLGGRLLIQQASPAGAWPQGADGATAAVAHQGGPDQTPALPVMASKTAQAARDEYIRQMERRVTKDIFALDLEQYTPIELPKPKKASETTTTTRPARPARTREEIVQAQAKLLCLQMTIVSDTPTAIINGQVLGVGDIVNVKNEDRSDPLKFRVLKITSHACVVAKDGVEVELRMK